MVLSYKGTNLSGLVYVRARLRDGTQWFPLILRQPLRCLHGADPEGVRDSQVCARCAETWSWDFDLDFERTAAGRNLAKQLDLDPATACETLRYRDGYEPRPSN